MTKEGWAQKKGLSLVRGSDRKIALLKRVSNLKGRSWKIAYHQRNTSSEYDEDQLQKKRSVREGQTPSSRSSRAELL